MCRVAVYREISEPPAVLVVAREEPADLIQATLAEIHRAAAELGGRIPYQILVEVVENLVHASFTDVVVSVLDGGNTIRVADGGPGIDDKERALLPGFSSGGSETERLIKGVGSGLAVARAGLLQLGGDLAIEDNLSGGTVITLHVPAGLEPPFSDVALPSGGPSTTDRQLRILLVLLEVGKAGPTRIGRELGLSSSTAYRELVGLEAQGLVAADDEGLRSITPRGLAHVEAVL